MRRMSQSSFLSVCLGLTLLVTSSLDAADLFVSATVTPNGDGSKERPIDLATAISAKSPAKPGDVIVLKGGTYSKPFNVDVSGAQGNPIQIKPVAGESVHLNGAME